MGEEPGLGPEHLAAVARSYPHLRLREIAVERDLATNKGAMINQAVNASRGDWIWLTDADCLFGPDAAQIVLEQVWHEQRHLFFGERRFLTALRPVFTDVLQSEQRLYLGGTAELLEGARDDELDLYRDVLVTLERRAALLELLGEALDPLRTWVRVGGELDHPALQDAALVGATYGLTNRALGAVGLLGPVRMDYDKAIRSVRAAAQELSRFVEEVYEDN